MHILAQPAFNNRKYNPYNWLLYTHIKNLGVDVDEFSPQRLLQKKYTILHLHWPELPLNNKTYLKAFIKTKALLLQIDWLRSRGVKTVFTIHNLSSHEHPHPQLEGWFWEAFIQRIDGCISLSHAGLEAARKCFPRLHDIPGFVVPHGHYRDEYPVYMSPQAARAALGISPSAKVLLFFGRIRAYKNVPQLIQAFRAISDSEAMLYIVGRPDVSLVREIESIAGEDSRVQLQLGHIPADKAQLYFQAADLVILPYREILNSGSALLALSFNCPILVPLQGALGELQAQVGREWVQTYVGEILSSKIESAMEWALSTPRAKQAPLETLDWKELAKQTVDAYTTITNITDS